MAWIDAGRALQTQLINIARTDREFPLLTALLKASAENTSIQADLLPGARMNGKLRDLNVIYFPPDCDNTGACGDSICDASADNPPVSKTLSLSKCLSAKPWVVSVDNVRLVDGNYSFSDIVLRQINAKLDGLRKRLALAAAAQLVTMTGWNPNGTASQLLPWVDPTSTAVRPLGLFEIQRLFIDLGLNSPYIVGGGDVWTWLQSVRYGSGNAEGVNVGSLPTANVFYDIIMNDAFSDSSAGHIFAFDPNAIKFVSYVKNADMFANSPLGNVDIDRLYRQGGTFFRGTFLDPVTGLWYDLDAVYDDCNDVWKFKLSMHWDILKMPDSVCLPKNVDEEDAGHDVNGLFHFTTCKAEAFACPEAANGEAG